MVYQYQANLYRNNPTRSETPVSPLISPLVSDFPLPSGNVPLSPAAIERNDAYAVSPPNARDAYHSHKMPRSPSISSISNASTFNSTIATTPANIYPPPAYVARFGASQVVSERKRRVSDDEADDDDVRTVTSSRDDMHFSQASLVLVNGFLDQLLYSFLGNAKSTTLTALRPAVRDVLKSRIATEAIASAEEELQELLAGGEDEEDEMDQKQTVAERNRAWDTELVWKRTRLRVMVYIRLGEMEDEDEQRYVQETELFHGSDRRFSHSTGLVSWAAAIFLTSVLEYIAEQVLQAAGHAADARARRQRNPRTSMSTSGMVTPVDGVTVEDYDMEKVALNSALGRLWRTWRKAQRNNLNGASPTSLTAASHNFSRRLSRDPLSPRRNSFGIGVAESVSAMDESRRPSEAVNDKDTEMDDSNEVPEAEYTEDVLAANIPLPLTEETRDVDEIEVPGLSRDPDEAETDATQTPAAQLKRRNSHTGFAPYNLISKVLATMGVSNGSDQPSSTSSPISKPVLTRQRSNSVPTRARSIFPLLEPSKKAEEVPAAESTPNAEKDQEAQERGVERTAEPSNTLPSQDAASQEKVDEVEELGSADIEHSVGEADEDLPFVEAKEYHTSEPSPVVDRFSKAASQVATVPEHETESGSEDTSKVVDETKDATDPETEAEPKTEENSKSEDTITTVKALQTEDSSAQETSEKEGVEEAKEPSDAAVPQVEESLKSMLKKLAPGSAAAAEAAFLIVYGDKFSKTATEKDTAPPAIAETAKDQVAQDVPPEDAPATDEPSKDKSVEDEPEKAESGTEEQKPLDDMKRLSMPPGMRGTPIETIMEVPQSQEAPDSTDVAQAKPQERPVATRERSPTGESNQTFTLGERPSTSGMQQMYVADAEDVDDVANIGLARTSDVREEEAPAARDAYRNSYTTPRRQSRLVLVGSPDSPTSPRRREAAVIEQDVDGAEKSPEEFLAERSLVSPKQSDLEQVNTQSSALQEQTRSPAAPASHRTSLPSALVLAKGRNSPPGQEKAPSPWRQSFSAATEKTASWVSGPKKASSEQTSNVPVQEHPAVQRMASMKRSDKEDKYPLTSASIRGPEDFDMFVQGGDTLKYTLTPENVRDDRMGVNNAGSAVRGDAGQAQADALPQPRTSSTQERTTPAQQNKQPPLEMRPGRSTSIKQATSAVPVPPEPEDIDEDFQPRKNADKRRSISRPPVRNTSVHRKSGLMAREPQVVTESTRDFADFIRSTGPSKDQEVLPILTSKSTTSLHSLGKVRTSISRSSSPGGASMRSLNRATMRSETAPPVPTMPKTKSHMLPRPATSDGEGSSELINFIRSGPNDSSEPGQKRKHRISRTIAPFRTTMDSDQLQEWGERLVAQPDLKLNTSVANAPSIQSSSSMKSSSVRTSANSRSALLPSTGTSVETTQPAYSGQAQRLSTANTLKTPTSAPVSALPEPTEKKRYRNKDPYAIDISDEDEDFLTALPRGKREEESLIDFLRNSGPSEGATTNSTPATTQSAPPVISPRRGSAPTVTTDGVSMNSRRGSTGPRTPNTSQSPISPRNGTTTIAVGPITKPRPKFEPRPGSKSNENTTGELADFLRSSGPPGGTSTPPSFVRQSSKTSILSGSKNSEKKRKGWFSGSFFSRKPQGTIGKAYLDM